MEQHKKHGVNTVIYNRVMAVDSSKHLPHFLFVYGAFKMAQFEETRRIDCTNALGRHMVIIEQKKWPRYSLLNKPLEPIYDYMTEDGQVASKLGDEFLLLLTDEIYHVA